MRVRTAETRPITRPSSQTDDNPFFAVRPERVKPVTPPIYVAYRQAPTPAYGQDRSERPARREHDRSMERTADTRQPAGHGRPRSKPGQVVAGEGPVRSTGFSRALSGVSVLGAEGVKYDALNLRNTAAPEPEDHRTKNDALNLRNTAAPEPEDHRTKNDALNLRNTAAPEPEDHRTKNDALNLRNTAAPEPEDHRTKNDALNLRNTAAPEPEDHRTKNDALNLRNTAPPMAP